MVDEQVLAGGGIDCRRDGGTRRSRLRRIGSGRSAAKPQAPNQNAEGSGGQGRMASHFAQRAAEPGQPCGGPTERSAIKPDWRHVMFRPGEGWRVRQGKKLTHRRRLIFYGAQPAAAIEGAE